MLGFLSFVCFVYFILKLHNNTCSVTFRQAKEANLAIMWYDIKGKKRKSAVRFLVNYCETCQWLCVLITCVPVWQVIEVRVQDAAGPYGAAKPEEELKAWAQPVLN